MATAVILSKQKQKTRRIEATDFSIAKISEGSRSVKINQVLPFRVRFTNIMIPGYSPNNVPPIGIAVIGLNNYIL
jgi:adenylate cyclase